MTLEKCFWLDAQHRLARNIWKVFVVFEKLMLNIERRVVWMKHNLAIDLLPAFRMMECIHSSGRQLTILERGQLKLQLWADSSGEMMAMPKAFCLFMGGPPPNLRSCYFSSFQKQWSTSTIILPHLLFLNMFPIYPQVNAFHTTHFSSFSANFPEVSWSVQTPWLLPHLGSLFFVQMQFKVRDNTLQKALKIFF